MAHLARVQQALAALEAASTFAASRKLTAEEVAAASVVSSEAQTAVDTGELALATAAQSQALARSLVAVVSPLPLLEQPLLGALRNTRTCRTALSRLVAAADVLRGGALLAGPLHLPAEAVVTLAAASSVLVVAGTPLLSRLAPPSSALHPALVLLGPDDVHMTATHLLKALYQLGDTVLPKGQAPHAAARRALLKGGFAPRRLLPFLSATVQAVEAAAESPAAAEQCQMSAVGLFAQLMSREQYTKQRAALAADRPLLERLVALLLRCLAAAAGDPGQALSLLCAGLGVALNGGPAFEQLRRVLCSNDDTALAAVRDAAAVLRCLPLQHATLGGPVLWTAHWSAAALLASTLGVLPGRPPATNPTSGVSRRPAQPPEVERPPLLRQAGQVALETVPALAAAAAAMTQLAGAPQHRQALGWDAMLLLYERYQRIVLATADVPPMCTAAELLAWLAAADAMLRLLPMPAEVAAELAALPPGAPPVDDSELAAQLAHRCMGVFSQTVTTAGTFLPSLELAALQAIADDTLPALVALHSRACRLVHWSQAGGPQCAALVGSALPKGWPALANRLAISFLSCSLLLEAKGLELAKEDALDSPLAQDIGLMYASLCAAHLEALAVLARRTGLPCLLRSSDHFAQTLGTAAVGAPALALLSPAWRSLEDMLNQLVLEEETPEWRLADKACVLTLLLWTHTCGPVAPQVAVALLPSTAALLRKCAAALSSSSAAEDHAAALEYFVGAGGGSLVALGRAHGEAFGIPGQADAFREQLQAGHDFSAACHTLVPLLPRFEQLAAELRAWQQQPEQLGPACLAAGRAAAVRACAYLACPNVGVEGGMVAGQGAGCKRCGGCRSVWYCGPACSRQVLWPRADWKQHKAACALLRAEYERQAQAGGQ